MLILSLDSAGSGCGVCVWQDGAVLAVAEERMERGQDARLVPLVQEVMAQAGVSFAQLDRLAVTRGPGSFTGLRIGLAAARGMGLAAGKPVVGIDRFAIHHAQQAARGGACLVVLESRRLELYTRFFSADGTGPEPRLLPPQEIASFLAAQPSLLLAGDGAEPLRKVLPDVSFEPLVEPESVSCAKLACVADLEDPSHLPRPLYLRAPDVTLKPDVLLKKCESVP